MSFSRYAKSEFSTIGRKSSNSSSFSALSTSVAVTVERFDSFVPVESPAAVEAWFRAEAKTDPTLLEGSGLDAEDIGVFHKNSLEKCSGVRYAYHNLGNMVLLPRVDVVLMKAAGLG